MPRFRAAKSTRFMKQASLSNLMTKTLIGSLVFATASMLMAAPDGDTLFVQRIQPLFKAKCLACHGEEPAKLKSGYDMRDRESLIKGGESGTTAVIPGRPDDSPLFIAVTRAHEDEWKPMPPKQNDKLTAEQVDYIKQWISAGAPWPDDQRRAEILKAEDKRSVAEGIQVKTSGALSEDWAKRRYKPENLWAYQPVKPLRIGEQPVDALIAMHLPTGLKPAPRAAPLTLIRRITYDLTGLPPTPEEVSQFLTESIRNPQSAIRNLIDRLLESPHYGEHWGRHWLDVVRYADSSGFSNDYERGNTWRYRDYVIRSFNSDKPYNQFITEQVAGDEIAEQQPSPNAELLIACGFLRMGPWELTAMEVPKIARQRFLDDVTNSVGEVFLAHSLQCARCHDHKFDPIPTHDYYSMQACFATTQLVERQAPFLPVENTQGFSEKRYMELRRADFTATLQRIDEKLIKAADAWFAGKKTDRSAWDQAIAQARKPAAKKGKLRRTDSVFEAARTLLAAKGVPEDQYPPKQLGFTTEDYGMDRIARKGLERLQWELDRYEPIAFSVYSGRTPQVKSVTAPLRMPADRMTAGDLEQVSILAGGDPFSPARPVQPAALGVASAFSTLSTDIPAEITGRRRALAQWITSKDNPLTARVMMNRVWLWHFGQPIAGNPNNFGSTGKKPTHPELLDCLADKFMQSGWSLKAMHRVIMNSEAYLRSAEYKVLSAKSEVGSAQYAVPSAKSEAPPTQHSALSTPHSPVSPTPLPPRDDLESLYAVFKPRRLSAEELRDSMLAASGELNPAIGGIPARPEINLEAAMQPRQVMGTFASAWEPAPKPEDRHRRSVYVLKIRGLRDPFMEVFNEPAPDFSCERRDASTVTPQVFSLFNGQSSHDRALALAHRVLSQNRSDPKSQIENVFTLALGRRPSDTESAAMRTHWDVMTTQEQLRTFAKMKPPSSVTREAVEENTGAKFRFNEPLHASQDYIPDLQPGDVDARTRALADVCLVLFNTNEFSYVY